MKTFGQRLTQARKNKGFTQDEMAKKIGLTQSSLSGFEKNISKPSIETLASMCELLDITSDWLLFGQGSVQEPSIHYNVAKRSHFNSQTVNQNTGDSECWRQLMAAKDQIIQLQQQVIALSGK